MFGRYHIEGNYQPQAGLNEIFGKMNEILNVHAPQEERDYSPRGLHPMISPEQAARELLELFSKKN